MKPTINPNHWIFLSPHLDDGVLSCGGMIFDLVQAGAKVEIWTICAADPAPGALPPFAQSLHERWQTGRDAVAQRRTEDLASCRWIHAIPRHLPFQDCIYRFLPNGQPLIQENDALFAPLSAAEAGLADALTAYLLEYLPANAHLVSPLTLGGHVDHHLTRIAAERLARPLYYYADYPYAALAALEQTGLIQPGWSRLEKPVSEAGLQAWQNAIGEHRSQISTFWGGVTEMRQKICEYWQAGGGGRLWLEAGVKNHS